MRTKLAALRSQLKAANGGADVSDERTFSFLRHFHLLGYDLDVRAGVSLALIKSHIGQFAAPDVNASWALVCDEVSSYNQVGGIITPSSLPNEIRELFAQPKQPIGVPPQLQVQPSKESSSITPAQKAAFAVASLLGAWREDTPGDREAIDKLLGKP